MCPVVVSMHKLQHHSVAFGTQFIIFLARLGLTSWTASARSFQDGGGSTCLSQYLIISLTHCWQLPGWSASIRSKIVSGISNRVPITCQFLASGRRNFKQCLGDRVTFACCFCFLRWCSILSTLRCSCFRDSLDCWMIVASQFSFNWHSILLILLANKRMCLRWKGFREEKGREWGVLTEIQLWLITWEYKEDSLVVAQKVVINNDPATRCSCCKCFFDTQLRDSQIWVPITSLGYG